MPHRDLAATFIRWSLLHAVLHRGWWLVTSLYLVVVADLSASQLVFYGAAMALIVTLAEVPTGVMADAVSRKWSLVIGHLVKGAGMVMVGLVTDFSLILVTQLFWGLGGTFLSGADVAWITDELDEPDRISTVLIRRARWDQVGAAGGVIGFGVLAWATDLATAVLVAGSGMILLGLFVALRFTERNFTPTPAHRWRASLSIFRRGVSLARRDRQILVVLTATFLVNGGGEGYDFLVPKQFVELGLPTAPNPILWLSTLGLVTLALAALALRVVEAHIVGVDVPRRVYAAVCFVGTLGLIVFGYAPDEVTGMAGVLLVSGIAWPVSRSVGVIWVNQRVTSDVRATVHSFLSQAESVGELVAGVALALLARATDISTVLASSAGLVALAGLLVVRSRASTAAPVLHEG